MLRNRIYEQLQCV